MAIIDKYASIPKTEIGIPFHSLYALVLTDQQSPKPGTHNALFEVSFMINK